MIFIWFGDLWFDDLIGDDYNMMVCVFYFGSYEWFWCVDFLYDFVIFMNWNWLYVVKGCGFVIFIY